MKHPFERPQWRIERETMEVGEKFPIYFFDKKDGITPRSRVVEIIEFDSEIIRAKTKRLSDVLSLPSGFTIESVQTDESGVEYEIISAPVHLFMEGSRPLDQRFPPPNKPFIK